MIQRAFRFLSRQAALLIAIVTLLTFFLFAYFGLGDGLDSRRRVAAAAAAVSGR